MMSKFWFLVGNSFKKKAKSKWFVIVNVILLIAIVGIINIDSIIKAFGGDFDKVNEIIIIDKTGYSATSLEKNLNSFNSVLDMDYEFNIEISTKDLESIKDEIVDTDKTLIVLDEDDTSYISASIISDTYMDTAYYQFLYQALTATKQEISLGLSNIDPNELAKLSAPVNIERVFLNEDKTSTEEQMEMVMGTVFPTVILPFFMLVIFLIQMIGAEINEEKQTRSMEIIISNVSPKVHFFSKLVASNTFVLLQGLLLFGYGLLAFFIKNHLGTETTSSLTRQISDMWHTLTASGFVDKLSYILPLTIVLMILSFITYSLIAGILASMTVNMEDYQHIQTPIMMILLAGYYLAIMAGMFEGSIFIRFLSYVPLISCLLSPALLVLGQIGIVDVLIAIVVLILFNVILVRYGLRIYKIGILNYSTDKMWKKIFKAARTKE